MLLVLASAIYFYGGIPFFKGLVSEVRDNAFGMMILEAITTSVAFFYSVAVAFGLPGMDFFLGTGNVD